MNPRIETPANTAFRWIGRVIIAAIALYVLWRVREIIVTVLVAAVLAAALEPIVSWLCRRRIRMLHPKTQRVLVAFVVFAAFIALFVGGLAWLAAPVGKEIRKVDPEYVKQLFSDFGDAIQKAYADLPPFIREVVAAPNGQALSQKFGDLAQAVIDKATVWLSHLLEIFLIPVLAFYFVVDSSSLKKYVLSFVRPWQRREAVRLLRDASEVFRVYIVGQIILCLIAGVVMGLLLAYWQVKYSVTLAVLAGVTRAVPIVGPIFSGGIIFLIILATNVKLALTVLAIFAVLHFVESKVIMPVLLGDLMALHPAVLLISILMAYEFFGILGMFLAAPVAAMSRTLITRYYLERRDGAQPRLGPGPGSPDLDVTGPETVQGTSTTAVA